MDPQLLATIKWKNSPCPVSPRGWVQAFATGLWKVPWPSVPTVCPGRTCRKETSSLCTPAGQGSCFDVQKPSGASWGRRWGSGPCSWGKPTKNTYLGHTQVGRTQGPQDSVRALGSKEPVPCPGEPFVFGPFERNSSKKYRPLKDRFTSTPCADYSQGHPRVERSLPLNQMPVSTALHPH